MERESQKADEVQCETTNFAWLLRGTLLCFSRHILVHVRLHMSCIKLMCLPRKVRFRVTGRTRVDWGVGLSYQSLGYPTFHEVLNFVRAIRPSRE